MASTMSLLFAGVTTSPAREFVASQIDKSTHQRIVLPCVGRWAVPTAAVAIGIKPEQIEASDLSLFSTLIGFLADPRHSVEELQITVPDQYAKFVANPKNEVDFAAGVMLAIKMMTTPAKNTYAIEFRRELWARHADYRESLGIELQEQVDVLKGCRYDIQDVRTVMREIAEADDAGIFSYVNLPGYEGGYTKMYGVAEEQLWHPQLPTSEFSPDEALPTLDQLTDKKPTQLAYIHHGDEQMPFGWHKLMAISPAPDRIDYIVSNQDLKARSTVTRFTDGLAKRLPIFDDTCEITPESQISFLNVDKNTGLHFRDLFVHRLGQTRAEKYVLMLIDGKVVTSCGLLLRDVVLGKTDYLAEVYGISVTSKRYARLGKLFMLALTSGDFKRWALGEMPQMHMSDLKGIQTASPALHHEGKTDRGVLKLVRRVPLKHGGFQLLYRGDFRDDTWADVLGKWFDKWGHVSRPDWNPADPLATTEPQPTEPAKATGKKQTA